MSRKTRRSYLTAQEVGVLFGQERARQNGQDPATAAPISPKTVWAYVSHSRMEDGRYRDFPIPMPEYPNPSLPPAGQHAQWYPAEGQTVEDLERDLREWWRERPRVHTVTPAAARRADVVALIRARAGAGHRDEDIAVELAMSYGTTPGGNPYTAKVVEGIRARNGIRGGAFHRARWHGSPAASEANAS